jgi:hypothetical protein
MSRIDAIGRFLGLPPDDRSPLALLNITREQCDRAAIDAALARRLDRIDRHAESSTPDADTVRMALHAAAAQLADPAVRARILTEPGASVDAPAGEQPPALSPGERAAQTQAMQAFRRTAIRTILLCRGWNRKSRRMLAAVAGASGIAPEHMAVALRSLSGPMSGGGGVGVAPAPAPQKAKPTIFESFHEQPAGAMGVPSNVILGIGGAIAATAIILVIIIRELTPGAGTTGASADSPADAETATLVEPDRSGAPRLDRDAPGADDVGATRAAETARTIQEPPDPAGLVRTLRRCVELASTDPGEAAWRLEQAVSQLSGAWTMLEPATVEASMDAIMVFLIEAPPGGERSMRALNAVAAGAKAQASAVKLGAFEVAPAVWSCGALAEVISAPGAPEPVRRFALAVLASAVGAFDASGSVGFSDGALASLTAMTRPLSAFDNGRDSLAAWGRWREALDATTLALTGAGDRDAVVRRELETIDAIEALMRSGPSLAQRPDVYGELTALLGTLRWSPDSASGAATPARLALLRWFDDHTIETEDLALVTEWIVRESETPGIGIQMALRRNAGVERRAAQRDRYAAVWSLGDGLGADDLAVEWSRAATRAITNDRKAGADIVGTLVRAAGHSRLNEAAARRWRRETTAARLIMNDPLAIVEHAAKPLKPTASLENSGGRRDGAWALEFLGAGSSAEQKFAAISRLELWGGAIGPIDGDVLARAALLGSPIEVRIAAQRTARKRADEPAVINGLLESISVAPRNDSTRALIESVTRTSLPSPRNPAWARAARLALTERLLEMLAGRSGLSSLDRIVATMAASHQARAADESAAGPGGDATPDKAARALWSSWRTEAGRIIGAPRTGRSLEMIDRRRNGRLSLASGPVQRFAAEQSSIAEVMGYVVASERPSRAPDINAALDRLASERRLASSVFEQIEATERAMLALWMIRFGEQLPGSAFAPEDPA